MPRWVFYGEVFQEQGVHGALEADVKLGDLAFGQRNDGDPGEAQSLEHGGDIFLVTADAVEGLRQNQAEASRLQVGQKLLNAGAKQGRTRDGAVGIAVRDRPALAGGVFPALAQLVLYRGVALVVGGIARIKRNAGHGWPPIR